jgi:DNA-binding Lrp family transcriptional regulator
VGELDTETFYERVEEIAEALRLSPEAVEQRVETVIRRAARGGQKG